MQADRRIGAMWLVSLAVCTGIAAVPAGVGAQANSARVGVVRATDERIGAELANAVDDALLRDLAGIARVESPTVSPVAIDDIQLSIGCEGESRECLASVAETLEVDALVVRHLHVDDAGVVTLRLTRFDPAARPDAASAQATVNKGAESEVVTKVPQLVREVFGVAEPAAEPAPTAAPPGAPAPAPTSAQPPPEPADIEVDTADAGAIGPLTWLTLGVGAAVLTGGIVLGLSAESSYDDFQRASVETREDAQRLHDDFDALETKGTLATVLIPAGSAVLGLGVALLVLDLTGSGDSDASTTRVSLAPASDGAALTLRGRMRGL